VQARVGVPGDRPFALDVRVSARKGILRIYGKGERVREIPIHPQLRTALTGWLDERSGWPGRRPPRR
jgi:integrase/recombinase XerC